jgi:hypothetical protein
MDRVPDGGLGWRRDIQADLGDLEIQWLDPTNKPIALGEEGQEARELRHQAKKEGRYDVVAKQMKVIRCVDLRMVDISDFMIVNIDLDVHACGTYEETTTANRQKKPMLFHIEQGKRNTPDWLLAAVPHQLIFSKWADLKMYVRHVATAPIGQVEALNRWYFFNFTGI